MSFIDSMYRTLTLRKVFTHPLLYLLLVLIFIGALVRSPNVTSKSNYVITRDFFNVMKAGQFSIYDGNEQQLQYRIQSQFALSQIIELVAHPSKQVISKLNSRWFALLYEANITIFDSLSDKWTNGRIRKHFKFFGDQYTIEWNGEIIVMETKFASFTTEFHHQSQSIILAKFHKRWISLVWSKKYDLEIFSKHIPDSIYILALAAKDHNDFLAEHNSRSTGKFDKVKII